MCGDEGKLADISLVFVVAMQATSRLFSCFNKGCEQMKKVPKQLCAVVLL
jgi:hypothetical protein